MTHRRETKPKLWRCAGLRRTGDCYLPARPLVDLTQGDLVRIGRELQQMTVGDLARRSGISEATIAEIEGGRLRLPLDAATVIKISDALSVSPLLFYKEPKALVPTFVEVVVERVTPDDVLFHCDF